MAVCRRGQIEVNALYAGVHTDFCGHEELARLTAYAAGLRRRYGIRVDGALLDDVSEGYTMGLPQVLARSGIRGICFGPGVKAVVRGIQPDLPRLFYWSTPDGSRVLAGWTPGFWTYAGGSAAGYNGLATIKEFEALGKAYPYDAIFRHGGYGDNGPPSEDMRQKVLSQRGQAAYPDVRMARVGDFAAYVLDHFGKDLPIFQGDNPNSWADGTISLARETGMHRRSQSGVIDGGEAGRPGRRRRRAGRLSGPGDPRRVPRSAPLLRAHLGPERGRRADHGPQLPQIRRVAEELGRQAGLSHACRAARGSTARRRPDKT